MVVPKLTGQYDETGLDLMVSDQQNPQRLLEFMDRVYMAIEIARECGLKYVYMNEDRTISCHQCGQELVGAGGWRTGRSYVTGGRCDHCGTAVPIVALSKAEYDALLSLAAEERAAGIPALRTCQPVEPLNGEGIVDVLAAAGPGRDRRGGWRAELVECDAGPGTRLSAWWPPSRLERRHLP